MIKHIRTRLRFSLLRSTLIAIRGIRGKNYNNREEDLQNLDFNLIPELKGCVMNRKKISNLNGQIKKKSSKNIYCK